MWIFKKYVRKSGLCCKCFIITSLILYGCSLFLSFNWCISLAAVIQTQEEKDLHHPLDLMMMTTQQMVTTIPTRNLPLQPHPRNLWDQDHITTDSTRNRHPPSQPHDHPHPQEPIRRNLYISESEKKNTHHILPKCIVDYFFIFVKICQEIMLPFVQLTFIMSSLGKSWTRNSDFSWKCLKKVFMLWTSLYFHLCHIHLYSFNLLSFSFAKYFIAISCNLHYTVDYFMQSIMTLICLVWKNSAAK